MKIAKLIAESTDRPWTIDPDNRPRMEWNNHIVSDTKTICFMAHSGVADNTEYEQDAKLIASLANSAEALVDLVKAAREVVAHSVCCDARHTMSKALAALPEDWKDDV